MHDDLRFNTDTATICVFDPAALKHRLNDEADWWSVPDEEVAEVNSGNAFFVGAMDDGTYDIQVSWNEESQPGVLAGTLRCPSGRLFIGPGEQVSADGLEPDPAYGGKFFNVSPGNYRIEVTRPQYRVIVFRVLPTVAEAENSIRAPIRLEVEGAE